MKKIFLLILLISVIALPLITLAVSGGIDTSTGESNVPGGDSGGSGGGITMDSIIKGAVTAAWDIATAVVVILWLVTGILFLIAQGSPEKVNTAKKALFTSIAGTVIVIIAYSAMSIISAVIGAK
jgi:hypothetical protein